MPHTISKIKHKSAQQHTTARRRKYGKKKNFRLVQIIPGILYIHVLYTISKIRYRSAPKIRQKAYTYYTFSQTVHHKEYIYIYI
jgi:hypothetical protein